MSLSKKCGRKKPKELPTIMQNSFQVLFLQKVKKYGILKIIYTDLVIQLEKIIVTH